MKAIFKHTDILSMLCKGQGKWGIYASGLWPRENVFESDLEEITKAAPWLTELGHRIVFGIKDYVYLLFDTEEEMKAIYDQTVGDDGPTKSNSYNGRWRVYCMTCSPDGQLMTENT